MMTNVKTVLSTDESINDNYTMGIRRQQSGSVVIIWGK